MLFPGPPADEEFERYSPAVLSSDYSNYHRMKDIYFPWIFAGGKSLHYGPGTHFVHTFPGRIYVQHDHNSSCISVTRRSGPSGRLTGHMSYNLGAIYIHRHSDPYASRKNGENLLLDFEETYLDFFSLTLSLCGFEIHGVSSHDLAMAIDDYDKFKERIRE